MEKIRVDDLTFQYPLSETPALREISLTINESDFVVVCGKSGCGKSTLLRQLKKALEPYGEKTGGVYYEGQPLDDLDPRRDAAEIGFVLQNPESQIVTDKVWHELAFGLESLGLPNGVIKRRVAEMASYFGINSWFRKEVASLSGGQKQMLNLASVMAMQPKVLILDEPASQLDPIAASDFLNTIHRINRDLGTTIVISEHRLEDVFPMADRVVVLDQGRVLVEGDPSYVGKELEKRQHPMYFGMPSVMRAFPEEACKDKKLPLTIREGRLLLENMMGEDGNTSNGEPVTEKKTEEEKLSDVRRKLKKEERSIAIREVYFRYERTAEPVVRGLELEVAKGELFCLLGGNGSGKSTTLKLMAGLLKPQRGKIERADGLISALVPQDPQALFTEITAEEEILEGMADMGEGRALTDEQKIDRVNELLKLMEIDHLRRANPYDLSGGEQQRLAIAKVMAYKPNLLLLDEPTKGLDPFFKRTLGGLLKKLTDEGTTIFMVSHDIDFCAQYADNCAMFFDGEITSLGPAKSFFCGNSYYTTTANKLVRRWRNDIITCEEAREWIESRISKPITN